MVGNGNVQGFGRLGGQPVSLLTITAPNGQAARLCGHAPVSSVLGARLHPVNYRTGVQICICGMMIVPIPGKAGQTCDRFSGLTRETQK